MAQESFTLAYDPWLSVLADIISHV